MSVIRALLTAPRYRKEIQQKRQRLYRLAFSWCHDAALADDLVQETLTKAFRTGAQLRDRERLDPWLFRILSNCWQDQLRRTRDFVDIDEVILESQETPEQQHGDQVLIARVRAAIARLPLGQRQVLTLIDLEEVSYADASEILGIPVGTVMSRISRARSALKKRLEQDVDSEMEANREVRLRRVK